MNYRLLGRTGLRVSEIGLGGMGVAGKYGQIAYDQAIDTVRHAAALGINFFATSPDYGNSEDVFGEALAGRRQGAIVCTQVGTWLDGQDFSAKGILRRFPTCLRRLGVDRVDLVLIHDVQLVSYERIMGKGGSLEALRQLQREGVIGFVGISGRPAELAALMATREFDAILTFNSLNLLNQEAAEQLLPLAASLDIGVIVGAPFYQGLLSVPDTVKAFAQARFWDWVPARRDPEGTRVRLERLKTRYEGDMPRLRVDNLRFVLSSPAVSVTIPGAKSPQEAEENARASDLGPMTIEECQAALACQLPGQEGDRIERHDD